ncbi:hypothetical protein NDU88_007535 [Pleurodeles waltl]|uniref:Uncharacterized protein n=1 Tax=Pleurodeles waltl TaxID=8319 RepID=A0AAV7MHC4_PLEWA|nr:hypothetical protein NDU88_007535 [Pleurodeles waltl]
MAYYTAEEDYYQDMSEVPFEHQMEERLVEASQALIKAPKPFTQPLKSFGHHKLMARPPSENVARDDQPSELGVAERASMDSSGSFSVQSTGAAEARQSSSFHSSNSDQPHEEPKTATKCKSKTDYVKEQSQALRNLCFDPENIVQPRSSEWLPCMEVVHYIQDRLQKGFDKDIHSTLCSECSWPSLLDKVADTSELDPTMATFLKKFAKDSKRA